MLSRCFLDLSVSIGAFVIGLTQISSFSLDTCISNYACVFGVCCDQTLGNLLGYRFE